MLYIGVGMQGGAKSAVVTLRSESPPYKRVETTSGFVIFANIVHKDVAIYLGMKKAWPFTARSRHEAAAAAQIWVYVWKNRQRGEEGV